MSLIWWQVDCRKISKDLVTDGNIKPALVYIWASRSSVFSSGLLAVVVFIQSTWAVREAVTYLYLFFCAQGHMLSGSESLHLPTCAFNVGWAAESLLFCSHFFHLSHPHSSHLSPFSKSTQSSKSHKCAMRR